ncbi:MAG: Trp operon repressor [Chlamydiia bacterium]|nr:Trp operon repressor [Chlamydiia bacterium]MCH9615739.1 Trp operon repressor [Chlamydiia bacterium]MCH9628858.1 Trp operon repressor [Chlamydiia bacterium]
MNEGWKEFLSLIKNINSAHELTGVFKVILTPEEFEAIGGRILILQALLKGEESQREMAERLGVSIATITRGSNALKIVDEKTKEKIRTCLTGPKKKRSKR